MTEDLLGGTETIVQKQPVPTGVLVFYEVTLDQSCHLTPSRQPGYRLEVALSLCQWYVNTSSPSCLQEAAPGHGLPATWSANLGATAAWARRDATSTN